MDIGFFHETERHIVAAAPVERGLGGVPERPVQQVSGLAEGNAARTDRVLERGSVPIRDVRGAEVEREVPARQVA